MILETNNPKFMESLKNYVPLYGHLKVKLVDNDGQVFNRTLAWTAGGTGIMVLGYRRKHYGSWVNWDCFKSVVIPNKITKTESDKWEYSWRNALNRLEKSGLWEDVANDVRIALSVGQDKIKLAYKQYREHNEDKINAEKIKEIDERLVGYRDDGSIYARTSILWYMNCPAKIKKMYFGKYENDSRMEAIKEAMSCKVKMSTYGNSGYDVSFSYDPEKKMAFYSEEYKGCGNGHYYLALDATHALFYEDD